MTTTPSASDSGLNLDHMEALPETTDAARDYLVSWHLENLTAAPYFSDYISKTLAGDFAYHLARWLARRAAPVSAPIAGDALLEELLEAYTEITGSAYCQVPENEDLVARVRAALANQPAPTAAPEQVAQGLSLQEQFDQWQHARLSADPPQSVTPYDAYVAGRSSLPSEAAPLAYAIYGINGRGEHFIRDVKLIPASDDGSWKTDDDGLGEYWSGNEPLGKISTPSLPAAAPAAAEDELVEAARELAANLAIEKALNIRLRRELAALAHQPAQEQAEPVAWSYECLQAADVPEVWAEFIGRKKPWADRWTRNIQPLYAAPSQAAQHEAGDERAGFEKWYIESQQANAGRPLREDEKESFLWRRDDSAGTYVVCNPQWVGWQARAALATSPVVRAQSEESAGAPATEEWSFSIDEEQYRETELSRAAIIKLALAEVEADGEDGPAIFWIGRNVRYTPSIDADWVIEQMQEAAYEWGGEFAETFMEDVTDEEAAELKAMVEAWAARVDRSNFWTVTAVEKFTIVEARAELAAIRAAQEGGAA